MKKNTPRFITSADALATCPRSTKPEFAFIGRSNVGKSSLVNLLTGQRDLAKVSGTPGKTRLINFFAMSETWTLVDLPGYGYAKVGKSSQGSFNEAVGEYLMGRENLKMVFVLIDSRHEPKEIDLECVSWLNDAGRNFALVFTKNDLASDAGLEEVQRAFLADLESVGIEAPKVMSSSAKNKAGRGAIMQFIESQLPKRKSAKKKSGVSLGWLKKGK